ncbi:MAG: hypothetical protein WBX01_04460 [Nitrososphaeraceae archaeon]
MVKLTNSKIRWIVKEKLRNVPGTAKGWRDTYIGPPDAVVREEQK